MIGLAFQDLGLACSAQALFAGGRDLEADVPGKVGVGRIGTISGRTFGMAPEGRSERTEKVFRAVMADDAEQGHRPDGNQEPGGFGVPEQFFAPFVVFDYPGVALIDTAIHFNFAADGARELSVALAAPSFDKFARKLPRALGRERAHWSR